MTADATPKPVSFISVEGNWDRTINDARVEHAARRFKDADCDFIIASGTRKPGAGETSSPFLGARNATRLYQKHGIPNERIVPLHHFPFDVTYTTIEAFGNACAIGWLMCGFRALNKPCRVQFSPITLGAHRKRVALVNARACKALRQFQVLVDIDPGADILGFRDPPGMDEREARKVSKLQEAGGLIDTGIWFHGDQKRQFDDVSHMTGTFSNFVRNIGPTLSDEDVAHIVTAPWFAERFLILQALSFRANTGRLSRRDLSSFGKAPGVATETVPNTASRCAPLLDD